MLPSSTGPTVCSAGGVCGRGTQQQQQQRISSCWLAQLAASSFSGADGRVQLIPYYFRASYHGLGW
jgi:hypothetical protein